MILMLKIGPMTVLVKFLCLKDRLLFNLMCRKSYSHVLPRLNPRFALKMQRKEFADWLAWGSPDERNESKDVKLGLDAIEIGSEKGTYFGEWRKKAV